MPIEPFEFTYTLNSETTQTQLLNNAIAATAKAEYGPTSRFFVDESKLAAINSTNYAADAFGPVTGNTTTKYRTTSVIRAAGTDPVKVFAICNGQVLIQPQTGDVNKVNLILKPSASYSPLKIKYFIYRGVNKADLISSNTLQLIVDEGVNQPMFLIKLWKQYKDFYTGLIDPSTGAAIPVPTDFPASLIGYDETQSEDILIENYFRKNGVDISHQIPLCSEGEHLGNFTGEIGLDIVLDHGDYQLQNQEELFKFDLKFARKKEHVFDTATIPSSTAVKIKRYKEYIHQFMDAAAFWGSHIGIGIIKTIPDPTAPDTAVQKGFIKTNNHIFSIIVSKYQTQNKLYVYIQGENNRSYNYYDATRKVYGFSPTGQLNSTSGWPIIIEELTVTTSTPPKYKKEIELKLEYNIDSRIPESERHVAVDIISPNNYTSVYPLLNRPLNPATPATLPAFLIDKTAAIITYFPVNGTKSCAAFMMLYANLKQEFPLTNYYNDLFPVNFRTNFLLPTTGTENMSSWATYDKSRMINLDYVLDIGASIQNKVVFDIGKRAEGPAELPGPVVPSRKARRLYMAVFKRNSIHNIDYDNLNIDTITSAYKSTTTLDEYAVNVYNSIDFSVYRGTFTDGTDTLNSLSLIHKNSSLKKNSFFHLGITDEEYNKLVYGQATVPDIVPPATTVAQYLPIDADNVFFHLEEDLTFTNKNVQKFKLGFRFEDASGNTSTLFPATANEVFVYTIDGFYFFSKEYAVYQQYVVTTDTYIRNYEEKIGFENKEPISNKRYEDWFIEKDSGMKNKVDTFIANLSPINSDANFYNNAKTLVENSALAIWNQAVSTVQANANTIPDDRPLYWARLKMQVALKSHSHFGGGNNSKDLEDLIQLFEEKSRNYMGVTFPNTSGMKKILITGFDPFGLESNITQSNPSGVCASYLHGKTLGGAYIQTMIFPVRYKDFDGKKSVYSGKGNGVVEKYVSPFIGTATNQANMVITISQSGEGNYNIDRFATINRGGGSDNLDAVRVKNSDSVILDATEENLIWIETTLPKAMVMNGGGTQIADTWNHFAVYAQHYTLLNEASLIPKDDQSNSEYKFYWDSSFDNYRPLDPGQIFTTEAKEHNLIDSTGKKKRIIKGSGSDYLSNEIFYRVALARERWQKANPGQKFPTGHFHIAYIQFNDQEANDIRDLTDKYFKSNRTVYDELTKLLKTVEERITLGASNLTNLF